MTRLIARTLVALGVVLGLSASPALAQDKPAAKPAATTTTKAVAQKDKATVPAKATVDTATRPAAERRHEGQRYKSKDGAPCHSDKSADA